MSVQKAEQNCLSDPEQGRAYLKAALERADDEVFLQALHNIIDSFSDSDLVRVYGVSSTPGWQSSIAS